MKIIVKKSINKESLITENVILLSLKLEQNFASSTRYKKDRENITNPQY